jgi:hypothetical protein
MPTPQQPAIHKPKDGVNYSNAETSTIGKSAPATEPPKNVGNPEDNRTTK